MTNIINYKIAIFAAFSLLGVSGLASEKTPTDLEANRIVTDSRAHLGLRHEPLYMKVQHPRDPKLEVSVTFDRAITLGLLEMPEVVSELVPETEIQNLAARVYRFADLLIGSHFDGVANEEEKVGLRKEANELGRKQILRKLACGCGFLSAGVGYVFCARESGWVNLVIDLAWKYARPYQYEVIDCSRWTPFVSSVLCGCCQCAKACRTSKLAVGETNLLIIRGLLKKLEGNISSISYDKDGNEICLTGEQISKRLSFIKDFLGHPNMVDFLGKFAKLDLKKANTYVPKRIAME